MGETGGTMRSRTNRVILALTVAALTAVATAGCTSPKDDETGSDADRSTTTAPFDASDPDAPDDDPITIEGGIRIEVLSSQPDRATGPDARIRVTPEPGDPAGDLVVMLDDRDVTASLHEVDGALEGVVVGLVEGNNTIKAHLRSDPSTEAIQRVRSWPFAGPMISGPHRPLLACSTDQNGLGAPSDADCSAPTRVRWYSVDGAGQATELADPASPPPGTAEVTVTTDDGAQTVPFVIRRETGVLNRAVYDIVTIDSSPAAPDTDQSDAAWNRRLLYRYGPGCSSTHGQGSPLPVLGDTAFLLDGYAVATASFNVGSVQCNDVVSAETTMMVKERFIELFGEPAHTIGIGVGGGGAQVNLITQNYPGLLDGGVTAESFADQVTTLAGVSDCQLLERWFSGATGSTLTPEQRAAVTGHASPDTCRRWSEERPGIVEPTAACDPGIAPERLYDAAANRGGVRCTFEDESINVFGPDPVTGHARRPLDNVGIQYGLDALNEGVISFDQFIALNREVGGFDADGGFQELRHEADSEAAALAHETGRVSAGAGDQRKVPIITIDVWNDPAGDVHDHVRPFSLRDRLTFGQSPAAAPGLQIWTREPAAADPASTTSASTAAITEAVGSVDEWLSDLDGDSARGSRDEVLDRNRPPAALDNCLIPGSTEPVSGLHVYDEQSECSDRYVPAEDPRMAAGAPLANDVVKCSLKPIDPADYERRITDDEYEQLLEVFPTGVCDWELPGVGQTAPSMSDRTFEDVITPEQLA